MIAIDTNLAVRYLTGDHPAQSAKARALIDGNPVFVPITVMLATEWVLRSVYGYGASEVAKALLAFGGLPTVTVESGTIVANALRLAEGGMDFADALHLGLSAHCESFVTFDRKFIGKAHAAGFGSVREA